MTLDEASHDGFNVIAPDRVYTIARRHSRRESWEFSDRIHVTKRQRSMKRNANQAIVRDRQWPDFLRRCLARSTQVET